MSSLDKNKGYWRSLDEFESVAGGPEKPAAKADADAIDPAVAAAVDSEFPALAEELSDPVSRRRFMQVMGASMAFAGVAGTGCRRWEREEIVPLSERPDGFTPGVPEHYATSMELGGFAHSLVVKTFDGRPVKIEGNDSDDVSKGKSIAFAQASILHLYDPDRSLTVRQGGKPSTWSAAEAAVKGLQLGNGAGLHILSEATGSPTVAALKKELLGKYPGAKWHEYEPLSTHNEREGLKLAYGRPLRVIPHVGRAQRVVAIDVDFLVQHPAAIKFAREYALKRNPDQNNNKNTMMRLYSVESTFSNTGAMADHRLPLPSSEIPTFLAEVEKALDGDMPRQDTERGRFVAMLIEDLTQGWNRDRVLFVTGHRQPPEVHATVARLNHKVRGVATRAVLYVPLGDDEFGATTGETHIDSIKSLAAAMNSNQVKTLLILGGNPVYNAPADIGFASGLAKVGTSIHLSEYFDETSAACSWHLPRAHYLEAWGDARGYDGTVYLRQPLIEPLTPPGVAWGSAGGKSSIEILSLLARGKFVPGMDLVKKTFQDNFVSREDPERVWRRSLHNGFASMGQYKPINPGEPRTGAAPTVAPLSRDNLEVVFTPSSHTYDGRFANNAWLQETPDFMSKLTWDNAALINPNTADELGIDNGEMIEITIGERKLRVAAWTMPGQAKYSIAVSLGHGRTHAGRVGGSKADGVASAGFNAYTIRTSAAPFIATGAKARGLGSSYQLASTQEHWKMDSVGREGIEERLGTLVREGSFAEFIEYRTEKARLAVKPGRRKDPNAENFGTIVGKEAGLHLTDMGWRLPNTDARQDVHGNGESLWHEHQYNRPRAGSRSPRYKWGMSIDLDKCTGCNSCMLACQSENNVPVVGKKQVMNSREMHWIRIDRYFTGDDLRDNPQVAHQPVACQQCEMAPCEQVCPVGATVHSSEGLNDMVYNRCVGTRYCLNNCPFKVRRFNFTDYFNREELPGGPISDARNKIRQLLFNPDVTVRSRGVMEKCTFCIQRIQAKKIAAKNERRLLAKDEITVACQQACPSDAIEFGNLNDRSSKVSAAHRSDRSYALLSELNLNNRNLFLVRIRNPYAPEDKGEGGDSAAKKPEQG